MLLALLRSKMPMFINVARSRHFHTFMEAKVGKEFLSYLELNVLPIRIG